MFVRTGPSERHGLGFKIALSNVPTPFRAQNIRELFSLKKRFSFSEEIPPLYEGVAFIECTFPSLLFLPLLMKTWTENLVYRKRLGLHSTSLIRVTHFLPELDRGFPCDVT